MADFDGADDDNSQLNAKSDADDYYSGAHEDYDDGGSDETGNIFGKLFSDDSCFTITISVVAACVVVIAILILILKKKSVKGNDILILGLCNSGKTLLFSRLITNKVVETYISVKENKSFLSVSSEKPVKVNLVDIPGSDSIRLRIFDQYKATCKGIVFLVDSSTIQKEIKDAAEFLYIVLTDTVIIKNQVPILIICNKQDLGLAKGSTLIKNAFEKELNQLRQTKSAALEGVDGKSSSVNFLSHAKKDFSFSDHKKNLTEFIEFSCKKVVEDGSDVKPIKEWVASLRWP